MERGGMLGSKCKVWDLSLTLGVWDSGVGFIRLWTLQLQCLAFEVSFHIRFTMVIGTVIIF